VTDNPESVKEVKQMEFSDIGFMGMQNGTAPPKNYCSFLIKLMKKLKVKMKEYIYKNTCTRKPTAALFIIEKTWNNPNLHQQKKR
jgi:hypothetical protein